MDGSVPSGEYPDLLCELCSGFYQLGWMTGTGGSMAIRDGNKAYLAPSGVQKERMKPDDLFVVDTKSREVVKKPSRPLKQSDCTPLFFAAFDRFDSGACIHTHSQHAVMATLLWPGDEFRISHQEMIKGVKTWAGRSLAYHDTLVIPIIDNVPSERELEAPMKASMEKYSDVPALLVRRHGLFVWSDTWERCKTMTECIDYLLEIGCKMRLAGLETVGLDTSSSDRTAKRARVNGGT